MVFLQRMHYGAVIYALPRTLPDRQRPNGVDIGVVMITCAAFAASFLVDFFGARRSYGVVASCPACLTRDACSLRGATRSTSRVPDRGDLGLRLASLTCSPHSPTNPQLPPAQPGTTRAAQHPMTGCWRQGMRPTAPRAGRATATHRSLPPRAAQTSQSAPPEVRGSGQASH